MLSLAHARDKAREAVARGEDLQGQKEAEQRALTFGELASIYLEQHAKVKKRRWREDGRVLRGDLLPPWKRRGRASSMPWRVDTRFKLRLLTAQRGVEVLAMRWEHIDGD